MSIMIPEIRKNTGVVGHLHLISSILSSIDESQTLNSISTYVNELSNNLNDISTLANQLITKLDELSSKSIFHYINNVSMLKPSFDYPLNVSVQIYDNPSMQSPLGNKSFDSARPDCSSYIEALLITNTEDPSYVTENTQWMKPKQIGNNVGFDIEYNNAPVEIHLYDWMMNDPDLSSMAQNFRKNTQLYLRNEWYYTDDDGTIHSSDQYSQIVPSNAEQTAQRSIAVVESGSSSTRGSRNIQSSNVNYVSWDGIKYNVHQGVLNILQDGIKLDDENEDLAIIQLNDYSEGNEYNIKFVAMSDIELTNDAAGLRICNELGETLDAFNGYDIEFRANKTYLIKIFAGLIQVLSEK